MTSAMRSGGATPLHFHQFSTFAVTTIVAAMALAGAGGAEAFRSHSPRSHLQRQYEASCFSGCQCNATQIECRGLGETTTELFRYISPVVYPQLDTLIITGNRFGDLPNENLFGDNWRHRKLTLVNISDNGIRSFGAQTFIGMPRVEYFYMADNRLEDVVDTEPFNFLTSLRFLDMSRAFGSHISVHARADLVRQILQNNHSFVDLQEVLLEGNRLDHLHPETFCNVKGLTRLNLAHNELTAVAFRDECLESLKLLDVSDNRIATVPSRLWEKLPALDTVDVSRNPLRCDCTLEPFRRFAADDANAFLNGPETRCASPKRLAGKRLFELTDTNLCRFGASMAHWLMLALGAAGVLIGYRYCRQHNGGSVLQYSGVLRRNGSQCRVPLVPDGYSQLKSSVETVPSPAFV